MVKLVAHEQDFGNHLTVISKECGWDEYIEKAALLRFLATRDNADLLFDEFKDFLTQQRCNENNLLDFDAMHDDEEDDDLDEDDDFDDDDDLDEDDDDDLDEAFEEDDDGENGDGDFEDEEDEEEDDDEEEEEDED